MYKMNIASQFNVNAWFKQTMLILFFMLSMAFAQAQITSTQSGDWSSSSTWIGGVVPSATDNVLIDNGHTVTLTAATTTSGSLEVAGTLVMAGNNMTAGSLSGGGVISSASAAVLTVGSNNGNTTFSGIIGTGAISVTKEGSGNLTLSGANTYTGTTTVSAGTLTADGTGNLSEVAVVSSGATLALGANNYTFTSLTGDGTVTTTATLTINNSSNITFAGVISGSGALTKTGSGELTLSGANTYTGATAINGGKIIADNATALGNNSAVTLANTSGVALELGANLTIGTLSGGGTNGGNIALGSHTLTVNQTTDATYAGEISGSGSFTKLGSSNLTFETANIFTGITTVSEGTITTDGTDRLSNEVVVSSGATLALGANNYTFTSLTGDGTVTTTATLTIDNSSNITFAGVISGSGANLAKTGSGELTLSGANTYTGATNLDAGTLILGDDNVLSSSSDFNFGGGTLNTNGKSQTLNNISLLASTQSTMNLGSGSHSLTFSGTGTMNGQLTINGWQGTYGNANGSTGTDGQLFVGTSASLSSAALANIIFFNTINYDAVQLSTGEITPGATATFVSTQTGDFNNPATWGYSGSATAGVNIPGSSNAFTVSSGHTVTLTANTTSSENIEIEGTLAMAGYNLTVGSLEGSGTLSSSSGTPLVTIGSNNENTTFSGIIGTGAISVTKTGSGELTLNGANTYTGATAINGGKIIASNTSALGDNSAVTLANTSGVALELGANLTIGTLSGGGTSGGNIALGSHTLTVNQTADATYAGEISGSGAFTKSGSSNLTLSGANTYTGTTTVSAGTLTASSTGNLSEVAVVSSSATLALGANNYTFTSLTGAGTVTTTATLTIDNSSNITFAGVISGSGALTKTGSGELTLSGANTYTGATAINGGKIIANHTSALGNNSAVTLANTSGVALDLGANLTIGTLSGGGTSGGNIALGSHTLTVNQTADASYAGIISGSGALTKSGSNNLTLSGANTYTGTTTVSAGTLTADGTGNLSEVAVVSSGATLALGANNYTFTSLTGDGTVTTTATLTINNSSNITFAGVISGSGANLTKTNSGNFTFGGNNTYDGTTTVSAGTLTASTADNLSTVAVVTSGATLALGSNNYTFTSLTGDGTVTTSAALTINNSSNVTFDGEISGSGSLIKSGSANLTLRGANSYSGATRLQAGTLILGTNQVVDNSSELRFEGGTLQTQGFANGFGNLSVISGSSTLILGSSGTAEITFDDAGTFNSGAVLSINNWQGTFGQAAGSSGSANKVIVGTTNTTLSASQLDQIKFFDGTDFYDAVHVASANGEISPSIIAPFISVQTGDWNDPASWGKTGTPTEGVNYPSASNNVVISEDDVVTLVAATSLDNQIEVLGTLNLNENNFTTGMLKGDGELISATGNPTLTVGGEGNHFFEGVIANAISLTKVGNDSFTLFGKNTYTGTTTITDGTLILGYEEVLSPTTAVVNNAHLDLAGQSLVVGSLAGDGLVNSSQSGSLLLTVGQNNTNTTFSGMIEEDDADDISLVKKGTGVMTLSGLSTYQGRTIIEEGAVLLGAAGDGTASPLGTIDGATVVLSGAALDLNGFTLSINDSLILNGSGPANTGALQNSSTTAVAYSGPVFLESDAHIIAETTTGHIVLNAADAITGAFTLTLGGISTASSVESAIQTGSGGLTKIGAGTWTLAATNTYSGTTQINEGTLSALEEDALGNGSNMVLADLAGVTVLFNNNNQTLGSLAGGGSNGGLVDLGSGELTVGNATSTTYNGLITGSGDITKLGSGVLTLGGNNDFSGLLTIDAGTVRMGAAPSGTSSPLGTTVAGVVVNEGGSLDVNGFAILDGESLSIEGSGVSNSGALANTDASIPVTINQLIVLTGDASIVSNGNLIIANTGSLTDEFALTLGGTASASVLHSTLNEGASTSASIIKEGTGTWILEGTNDYTGTTTVSAGTLRAGNGNTQAFGNESAVTIADVAGAILDLNDNNTTLGSLAGGGNTGGQVLLGSATLTTGGDNSDTDFDGVIDGTGNVIKDGTGTWTLSGSNTYTGTTTVDDGVLKIGSANTLPTQTPLTLNSPGRLDLDGNNLTIGSLAGDGTVTSSSDGTPTLTTGGNNGSTEFSGVIEDDEAESVSLTKTGTGTFTLSGVNTYIGTTTISAGTLKLDKGSRSVNAGDNVTVISDTSHVAIASGATFDLNGFTEQVGNISGAGTITSSVNGGDLLLVVGEKEDAEFSGVISLGSATSLSLQKKGEGKLTLSGATNSFNGFVRIMDGTIRVNTLNNNGNNSSIGTGDATSTFGSVSPYVFINSKAIFEFYGAGGQSADRVFEVFGSNTGIQRFANDIDAVPAILNRGSSGTLTLSGSLLGSNAVRLGGSSGNLTVYNGQISVANVFKTGNNNIWEFGNTGNNYTGFTSIHQGTLRLGASEVIPNGSRLYTRLSSTTFDMNGFSETVGSIEGFGTIRASSGTTVLLTNGGDNSSTNYNGPIINGGGVFNMTKVGGGILTLFNRLNNFSGDITISGGTLRAGNVDVLGTRSSGQGTGTIVYARYIMLNNSGATLEITHFNNQIGSLEGGGTTGGNVELGGARLTMGRNNLSTTFSGVIKGADNGTVRKEGTGTLTFATDNTYTGITTVNNGVLAIGVVQNFEGGLAINQPGKVDCNALTSDAEFLMLDGVQQENGTYGHTASTATNNEDDFFTNNTGVIDAKTSPQPGYWVGGTSSDWFDPDNWFGGIIPDSAIDVIIVSSATNQPVIDESSDDFGATGQNSNSHDNNNSRKATCKSINIRAGASLTITGTDELNIWNEFRNEGTFTPNSSTVYVDYNGTNGVQKFFNGNQTFHNLIYNSTSTNKIQLFTNLDSSFFVSNVFEVVNGGSVDMNAKSLNVGSLKGNGEVRSDVSGFTVTLTINGTESNEYTGIIKNGAGTVRVTKDNTGVQTFSGLNTYSGGTRLLDGTLCLNSTSAIGTSFLDIFGGALDNTSGADITLTPTGNTVYWYSGDFGYKGANSLFFNSSTQFYNYRPSGTISLEGTEKTIGFGRMHNYSVNTTNAPAQTTTVNNTNGGTLNKVIWRGYTMNNRNQSDVFAGSAHIVLDGLNRGRTDTATYAGMVYNGSGILTLKGSTSTSDTMVFGGVMRINSGTVIATDNANALGYNLAANPLKNPKNAVELNGGILVLSNDASGIDFKRNITVLNNATILSDREASGSGLEHKLGKLTIGSQTLTIAAGENISSGTASVAFDTMFHTAAPTYTINKNTSDQMGQLNLGPVDNGSFLTTLNGNGNVIQSDVFGVGSNVTGGVTYNGTGVLTLNQANLFTGRLTVNHADALVIATADAKALGSGTANDALTLTAGTLRLTHSSGLNFGRNTTVNGNFLIETDVTAAGAGVIHSLGQLRIGAQTLTVQGGDLVNSGTAVLAFATTTLSGAPTFDVLNPASGNTELRLSAVTNAGNRMTFTGNGDVAQTGVWSGTGGVTYNGTGQIVFSQSNTYTGSTRIEDGTGIITNSNRLANTSDLVVNTPGVFALNGYNESVRTFAGTGTITNDANSNAILTFNGGTGGNHKVFSGVIQNGTGTGTTRIVKSGSYQLTLTGDNQFTGGVSITGVGSVIGSIEPNCLGLGKVELRGGNLFLLNDVDLNYGNDVEIRSTSSLIYIDKITNTNSTPITHTLGDIDFVTSGAIMDLRRNDPNSLVTSPHKLIVGDLIRTGGSVLRVNNAGASSSFPVLSEIHLDVNGMSGSGGELWFQNFGYITQRGVWSGSSSITINNFLSTATTTLNQNNTFTGSLRIQGPGRVIAKDHVSALGQSTSHLALNLLGGNLELQYDSDLTLGRNVFMGTTASTTPIPSKIIVNRETPGAGVTYTMGNFRSTRWNLEVVGGDNVTSGTAGLILGDWTNTTDTSHLQVNNPTASGTNTWLELGGSTCVTSCPAHHRFSGTGDIAQSGPWVGTMAVLYNGPGTLTLSQDNTFTGDMQVNNGTLILDDDNERISDLSTIFLAGSGAIFDMNGYSETVKNVMGVAGSLITSSASGAITLTITGTEANVNYLGVIEDGSATPMNVTKQGVNTWGLAGNNSFTGVLTLEGGTLRGYQNANSLGQGTLLLESGTLELMNNSGLNYDRPTTITGDVTIRNGLISSSGHGVQHRLGTLNIGAHTVNVTNAGSNVGTSRLLFGNTTLSGAPTFNVNNDGAAMELSLGEMDNDGNNLTFTGSGRLVQTGIWGAGTNKTGGIDHNASGTLVLSQANEYTGSTRILNSGTLQLDDADERISDQSALEINGTGMFEMNGLSETVASLSGNNNTGRIRNNISSTTSTLTVGGSNANTEYQGTIINGSGAVALTKEGTGRMILSGTGTNTYSGVTHINEGIINIRKASALGTTAGATIVAAGAALEIQNATTVGTEPLTLNGTGVSNGGALRSISGNNTWGGAITLASDARINVDADQLTLNATGSIISSGNHDITIGTLGSATAFMSGVIGNGSGELIKDGTGTLVLNANNTFTGKTYVNEGIADARTNTAFGTVAGGVEVADDAQILLRNSITVGDESLLMQGVGPDSKGALVSVAGTNEWQGEITLAEHTLVRVEGTNGTLTLSNNITGSDKNLTVHTDLASNTAIVSATLTTGDADVIKTGAGRMDLSGNNTFTGLTDVQEGIVRASHNNAFGTTAGGVTVANNAIVQLTNNITVGDEALNIQGVGSNSLGALQNLSGNNTWEGTVTLDENARMNSLAGLLTLSKEIVASDKNLNIGGPAATTVSGEIKTGTGTVTVDAAASKVIFSNTNTYQGLTTVTDNSLLNIQNADALGTHHAGTVVNSGSTIEVEGAFDLNDEALTIAGTGISTEYGALRNVSGNTQWDAVITLSANAVIHSAADLLDLPKDITGTNTALTLTGAGDIVSEGDITTGSGTLTKKGDGTLTLSGNNTYSGATSLQQGISIFTSNTAAGSTAGGVTVSNGAELQLTNNIEVGAEALTLQGTGTASQGVLRNMSGDNKWEGNITLAGNATFQALGSTQMELSGNISGSNRNLILDAEGDMILEGNITTGSGTLVKNNTGKVTLSGNSTYSGQTTVNAGVLNLQSDNAVGSTAGGVVVADGAALELEGGISVGNEALTVNGTGVSNHGVVRNISGDNNWGGAITLNSATTRFQSDNGSIGIVNLSIPASRTFEMIGDKLRISGTYNNSGTLDATDGGIEFDGSAVQNFTPATLKDNYIDRLFINNSSGTNLGNGVLLKENLSVNKLHLLEGILDVEGNTITTDEIPTDVVDPGKGFVRASYTANGRLKVKLSANEKATFQVGNRTYNPVMIENLTGSDDDFAVALYDHVQNNAYTGWSNTDNRVDRIWEIERDNSGGRVDFEFYWNTAQEVGSLDSPTLNHYNYGINAWEIAQTGTSDGLTITPTSVNGMRRMIHTGYTGSFSPFAIGGSEVIPLPVTLLEFTARAQAQTAVLNWITTEERNNAYFDVLRSVDGEQWEEIGRVAGAGNSYQNQYYEFVDKQPGEMNFYRLRQVDLDGTATLSDIRTVRFQGLETQPVGVTMYPIPSNGTLNLELRGNNPAHITLYDLNGKVLHSQMLNEPTQIRNLASGIYLLKVAIGDHVEVKKVVVSH